MVRRNGQAGAPLRGMGLCCSLLCVLIVGVVGCTSSTPEAGGDKSGAAGASGPKLRGNILIDGSSTVRPIGEAVAKRFADTQPDVRIEVGGRGTGNGFKRFASKEIDFSQASRPVSPNEVKSLQEAGVPFLEIPVAYDGLTIVVHPENDWVKQLTVDQLKLIYGEGATAANWSDLDPAWPAEPLKLFAPGTGSGTYDYFCEVVGSKLRDGISLNEDDNALVTGVAGNRYSIGFFGVAYFEENREKLRAVPIVNPETGEACLPERDAIENNRYAPFSRPLFIYVNGQSLDRIEVKMFLKFYLDSVSELAPNVGYVRLPANIWKKVEQIAADPQSNMGTKFVDEAGAKVHGSFSEIFLGSPAAVDGDTAGQP